MALTTKNRSNLGGYNPSNYDYHGEAGAVSINPPNLKNNEEFTDMHDTVLSETAAAATIYGYKTIGGAL